MNRRTRLGKILAVVFVTGAAICLSGCPVEPPPPPMPPKSESRAERPPAESPEAEATVRQTEVPGPAAPKPEGEAAPAGGAVTPPPETPPQTKDPTKPTPSGEKDELPMMANPELEKAIAETERNPPPPPREEPKLPPLGEPLVEKPEVLTRLAPQKPAWFDQKVGRVVMIGRVCQREMPLEMFACLVDTKEHESILVVDVEAFVVHSALLAIGATPGHPVRWQPQYVPATGDPIEVTLHWKDEQGNLQTARAQDWVRDVKTKKPMDSPFVFGGSGFWQDEQSGKRHYQAEGGDFICVSNFGSAMIDVPVMSTQQNDELMFEAFTERIPPRGTPVTMVLTVGKREQKPAETAEPKPQEKPADEAKPAAK